MIVATLGALTAHAEDWTVDGKDYHNVVVGEVNGDQVHITYDDGVGTIAISDLPPDVQKRLNYNPQAAKAAAAADTAEAQQEAAKAVTVRVGDREIKVSDPPGMLELPKDDPLFSIVNELTPPEGILLHICVSAEALDHSKEWDPATPIITSRVVAIKDQQMDVEMGYFIDFVGQVSTRVSKGVLVTKDEILDDTELQKQLDHFQKDTGVTLQADSDIYSLGMFSRSFACVSYITAQNLNATYKGKTKKLRNVSIEAYVLLKKKVVIAETSITEEEIKPEDVVALKDAGEKFQIGLQVVNNL